MKTWKLFWTMVLAGTVLSMGLTACGKKDSGSNESQGSATTDGQNVTITSTNNSGTIAGQAVSMQVRNIQAYGYGNIRFDMTLNGSNNSFNSTTQFQQYVQMGQFYVTHSAACADNSCNTLYVSIVIAGANSYNCNNSYTCLYEYKQVAIKKVNNVVQSGAAGIREWNIGTNTQALMTIQQVMSLF